jgi:hypothetical protein
MYYNYNLIATATASPQIISPGATTTLSSSGGTSYYWFADAPSYYSNQHGPLRHKPYLLSIPLTYFIQVEDLKRLYRIQQVFRYLLLNKIQQ